MILWKAKNYELIRLTCTWRIHIWNFNEHAFVSSLNTPNANKNLDFYLLDHNACGKQSNI